MLSFLSSTVFEGELTVGCDWEQPVDAFVDRFATFRLDVRALMQCLFDAILAKRHSADLCDEEGEWLPHRTYTGAAGPQAARFLTCMGVPGVEEGWKGTVRLVAVPHMGAALPLAVHTSLMRFRLCACGSDVNRSCGRAV